jgi:hypothetical protein
MATPTHSGAVAATAVPTQAEPDWHGGDDWQVGSWHGGYRSDGAGVAVAAGILGLAAGAAIANERPCYYDRGY